jgi:hypothetical protein
MIGKALVFLRDKLNEDLSSNQEIVVFPDGVKLEPLIFRLGAITLLLVNIEQEPPPQNAGFSIRQTHAENGLNLYVLFVSSFKLYSESLDQLSRIIGYLQSNPVFEGSSLLNGIEQMVLDPAPLTIAGQNELWGALRVSCQPSVLYRVRVQASPEGTGQNV